jgi:hypothetical protein
MSPIRYLQIRSNKRRKTPSPLSAGLVITSHRFVITVISLVYPITDSTTETIICRHIGGIQKLPNPQHSNTNTTPEEEAAGLAVI